MTSDDFCMNRDGGAYSLSMTVCWSRVHQQHHMTTCLIKFTNETSQLGIDFAFWLCTMNVIIIVNPYLMNVYTHNVLM